MVSAPGLVSHMFQVHKETLHEYVSPSLSADRLIGGCRYACFVRVPNARKGRESVELTIFGMQNIPGDAMEERRKELAELGLCTPIVGLTDCPNRCTDSLIRVMVVQRNKM